MNMVALLSALPLVERLGWALIHFLWQGALIAGLYWIARTLLVRPENARTRYALSCAALALMIAAPAVTLIANRPQTPAPAMTWIAGPFTAPPAPGPHSGSIPFESLPATAPATQAGATMTWLVIIWSICSFVLSIRLIGGWNGRTPWTRSSHVRVCRSPSVCSSPGLCKARPLSAG